MRLDDFFSVFGDLTAPTEVRRAKRVLAELCGDHVKDARVMERMLLGLADTIGGVDGAVIRGYVAGRRS